MTPIPRLGQGGRVRAEPMGWLQWRAKRPRPVLSCLSGLVWPGLPRLSLLSATAGNGVTDHPPRPEMLFDAPALTGPRFRPARKPFRRAARGLQEACKRRKTSETRQSSPALLGRRLGRQTADRHSISTVKQNSDSQPYSGRVDGQTVDRCTSDRSSVTWKDCPKPTLTGQLCLVPWAPRAHHPD